MLHPFRSGNSVIIVATYLPARSKGSMRAKAMPQQLDLFRSASLAPDRKLPHLEGSNQPPSVA